MAITVISLISNDLFSIYAVKAVASRCAEHEIRRKGFFTANRIAVLRFI